MSGEALAWLARATGLRDNSIALTPLAGATSSSVYLVTGADHHGHQWDDREPKRYVLRVLDNREWLMDEPDLAEHEAAALQEARKAEHVARQRIVVPRLVAHSTDDVGFGAPVVLMTYVKGDVDLQAKHFGTWIRSLAGTLADIHRHAADKFPWQFNSWVDRDKLRVPTWARNGRLWERAIDVALGPTPAFKPTFIHRDYHPMNVLWDRGGVGIVDWINACRGPAGVDVGHCRVNLALMFGPDAAAKFLKLYVQAADAFAYEPYWDVDAILNMSLPEPRYYTPWRHFGLGAIEQQELRWRAESFLAGPLRALGPLGPLADVRAK